MFERFDEDARRVLFFARVHASVRKGVTIDAWAERILGCDRRADTPRELPLDATAKAALGSTVVEADALDHEAIRPAHLLLGILRQEGTTAWQALMDAGVTLRGVREGLARDRDGT